MRKKTLEQRLQERAVMAAIKYREKRDAKVERSGGWRSSARNGLLDGTRTTGSRVMASA